MVVQALFACSDSLHPKPELVYHTRVINRESSNLNSKIPEEIDARYVCTHLQRICNQEK